MSTLLQNLHRALHPRPVAVVGARKADDYMWLRNMSTFTGGPVYSVNIDPNEIPGIAALGFKNYARLTDIPEPVDFAVVAVPRRATPVVLQDAITKGVAGVSMFTAGFAKPPEEKGGNSNRRLRLWRVRLTSHSSVRTVWGCMHPKLGIRNNAEQPSGVAGNVGFLSQSGTHAINFSLYGSSARPENQQGH